MKKLLILVAVLTAFAVAQTDPELNPPPSEITGTQETIAPVPDAGQRTPPENINTPAGSTPVQEVTTTTTTTSTSDGQVDEGTTPATCLGGGGIMSFLPMIAIIAIFYFLMIRPQQKQAKRMKVMREAMKISDKVVTAGGIHGVITNIKGDVATVRVADGVKIDVDKTSLTVEGVPGDSCTTCK